MEHKLLKKFLVWSRRSLIDVECLCCLLCWKGKLFAVLTGDAVHRIHRDALCCDDTAWSHTAVNTWSVRWHHCVLGGARCAGHAAQFLHQLAGHDQVDHGCVGRGGHPVWSLRMAHTLPLCQKDNEWTGSGHKLFSTRNYCWLNQLSLSCWKSETVLRPHCEHSWNRITLLGSETLRYN